MNLNDKNFHSMDLEKAVLASLMSIENSYFDISHILKPSDFFAFKHELIYKAISSLANANEPYDALMIMDYLKSQNINEAEYSQYLSELLSSSPATKFNLKAYCERLRALSALRQANEILITGRDILAQGSAEGSNYADSVNKIIENLTAVIDEKTVMKGAETISQLLPDFLDDIRNNAINEVTPFVKTGFIEIDNKVNIQSGELVVIGGRPAQGKTTLGQVILQNIVENTKGVAVFFSMEMAKTQVLQRFTSSVGDIILPKVTSGQGFDVDDTIKLDTVERKYGKNCNLFIDDRKLTVSQMRSELNKIRNRHGKIEAILVDYLQIVGGIDSVNSAEKSAIISKITESLKDFSKEYDCPVVALAQLNRNAMGRPKMSDLAECGGIERVADHIWLIYHPPVDDNMPPTNEVDIIVEKQRQGAVGTLKLKFEGQYSRFANLVPEIDENGIPTKFY